MSETKTTLKYSEQYAQTYATFRENFKTFYEDPETGRVEPFRIFGNLYYVGDKKVCMHLIDTGDGLILVDCGYGQTTYMIEDSIRNLGFRLEDLKWIIITHGHFDHFGSGNDLRQRYGCKIFMSRVDRDLIKERPDRALCHLGPDVNMPMCWPDEVIDDGDSLTLGNTTIHFRVAPGHTPGTLAYFMDVTDGKTVKRAGCWGGIGAFTVYKAHSRAFGLPEDMCDKYLQSARMLRQEHVDIHLGNHLNDNQVLSKRQKMLDEPGTNPFVDDTAWQRFLDEREAFAIRFGEMDD